MKISNNIGKLEISDLSVDGDKLWGCMELEKGEKLYLEIINSEIIECRINVKFQDDNMIYCIFEDKTSKTIFEALDKLKNYFLKMVNSKYEN